MGDLQSFALVDEDCRLPPDQVRAWAEATTIAAQRDFAAGLGLRPRRGRDRARHARRRPARGAGDPATQDTDQPGALGYHDPTRVIKVFPLLDTLDNAAVTIGHEVFEWLSDEDCQTVVIGPDGKLRLREAGDPVEADSYKVTVSSGATVLMSNFVGIDYFSGGAAGEIPRYDFLGLVRSPGEIRSGGYQTFYDPSAGYTQQQNGRKRAYREALDTLAAKGTHPTRMVRAARLPAPRIVDRFGCTVRA